MFVLEERELLPVLRPFRLQSLRHILTTLSSMTASRLWTTRRPHSLQASSGRLSRLPPIADLVAAAFAAEQCLSRCYRIPKQGTASQHAQTTRSFPFLTRAEGQRRVYKWRICSRDRRPYRSQGLDALGINFWGPILEEASLVLGFLCESRPCFDLLDGTWPRAFLPCSANPSCHRLLLDRQRICTQSDASHGKIKRPPLPGSSSGDRNTTASHVLGCVRTTHEDHTCNVDG